MLHIIVDVFICLLIADFVSGLGHWAEDTWGVPGRSPLLDKWVILPNIEHHRRPGQMRNKSYWETNHVTVILALVVLGGLLAFHVNAWQAYLTVALISQSNQIHKWAHSQTVPFWVRWLQRIGLLQSVAHHGEHHKRPYAYRFCTTTNLLNPVLDGTGFWHGLEWVIERCGISVKRATEARGGY